MTFLNFWRKLAWIKILSSSHIYHVTDLLFKFRVSHRALFSVLYEPRKTCKYDKIFSHTDLYSILHANFVYYYEHQIANGAHHIQVYSVLYYPRLQKTHHIQIYIEFYVQIKHMSRWVGVHFDRNRYCMLQPIH